MVSALRRGFESGLGPSVWFLRVLLVFAWFSPGSPVSVQKHASQSDWGLNCPQVCEGVWSCDSAAD